MEIKEITDLAQKIYNAEKTVKDLNEKIKEWKDAIKDDLEKKSLTEYIAGNLAIVIKNVEETLIADTDALKAAGIFEQYSKTKKGYKALTVKEIKS